MLLDFLTYAVIAYVGSRLIVILRRTMHPAARRRAVELLRGLRPRHFVLGPFVLAAIVVVFLVLYQIPPLRFGWWTAIGGQGNIIFGSTERTRGTPLDWLVPVVFGLLLIPALPTLVEREERAFRLGAEDWSWDRRVRRVIEFGLVHLVMGIPIAAALALSVGGAYMMWAYLRGYRRGGPQVALVPAPSRVGGPRADVDEAVKRQRQAAALDEATRTHLAYDIEVVLLVIVGIVSGL